MPEERRLKILELLYKDKRVTVLALCDTLSSSEATIRRDLSNLENEGKLKRTHGGAIINSNMPLQYESPFYEKEGTHIFEKREIAKTAFSYLRDNDSIFLDGGTTTLELAKLIGRSHIKLTIFTNSPHFSQYISFNPKVDQYIIGGKIRNNTLAVVGHSAIDAIKKFRLDKVFIGVNAISSEYGFTTPDFEEAEFKRAVITRGRDRFILADDSKFNKVALCEIAQLESIDFVITSRLLPETLEEFSTKQVTIIESLLNKGE